MPRPICGRKPYPPSLKLRACLTLSRVSKPSLWQAESFWSKAILSLASSKTAIELTNNMTANHVISTLSHAGELLERCMEVSSGYTKSQAGFSGDWVKIFAQIVGCADREQCFGLTRYPGNGPFEADGAASCFKGGIFLNKEQTLRRKLSK